MVYFAVKALPVLTAMNTQHLNAEHNVYNTYK